jgi:NADPH:quinone reductase-like Zn-dependent oxidoreductase
MKAMVFREFGGPEVLRLEDIATPEPGPGEVLVKVHNVSVNVTLDILVRKGLYARKPPLPHVLGCDPTGEVGAVGAGVTKPKVGDRVFVHVSIHPPQSVRGQESRDPVLPQMIGIHRWGGYAEYVAVPAKNAFVLPDNISYQDATVVMRHLPTARHQLHCRANLQNGEWILVMGASGGLASCCVQVAKRMGAKVIGAAGADDRVKLGLAFGADHGLNYRTQDLAAEVMKITDGKGVNVVAENVGDAQLWPAAFNCLARHGRMVTAGAHAGQNVQLDLRRLYLNSIQIIGDPGCDIPDIEWAIDALRDGTIKPPKIDRILPLAQAAEAHRLVERREVTGKLLLEVAGGL